MWSRWSSPIVVTTGIASIFLTKDCTPDYNSGLAHAVFYALTSYPVIEKRHLHGEVVGFGVLLALLVDRQEEEFEKIYKLNREIGLPVSLKEIEITEDEWEESMNRIPEMCRCCPLSVQGDKRNAERCHGPLKGTGRKGRL